MSIVAAILQGVCFLNQSRKVSAPLTSLCPLLHPPPPAKFSKCYHDFQRYSLLQQQFSNEKI